jgi:hypothetical protein
MKWVCDKEDACSPIDYIKVYNEKVKYSASHAVSRTI